MKNKGVEFTLVIQIEREEGEFNLTATGNFFSGGTVAKFRASLVAVPNEKGKVAMVKHCAADDAFQIAHNREIMAMVNSSFRVLHEHGKEA